MSDKNEKQALPNLVQDEIMNVKSSVFSMEMLASNMRAVGLDRSADIIEKECGLINAALCNLSNIVSKHFEDDLNEAKQMAGGALKTLLTMGEQATDSMGKVKP